MGGKVSLMAARAMLLADLWAAAQPRTEAEIKALAREADQLFKNEDSWKLDSRLTLVRKRDGYYLEEPNWVALARQGVEDDYLFDRLRDSEIDRYRSIIEDLA